MADIDRRGGYNNNNRKRRFRDDDNDYRQQRRRHDVPVPLRIRRQLLSIAESPLRRWSDDVVAAARLVAEHDDDAHVREGFVTLVGQLVCEQPLKTPFVAAVLLVLNTLKPAVVLEVLRAAARATEAAVAAGRWRDVKLHLRLLACLQRCLADDGVFPLLDTLFARAVDLQTASSDDVVGQDHLADDPWQQRAAELMEKTDIIASEPHPLQKLMDPYHNHGRATAGVAKRPNGGKDNEENDAVAMQVDGSSGDAADGPEVPAAENIVALLQKQLQAEAANGWPLACLPRPWQLPLEEVELQAQLDEQATKHPLPPVAVPETVSVGPRPLYPEVYFSVYNAWVDEAIATQNADGGDGAAAAGSTTAFPRSVPPVTDVAASLIRDVLLDTINVLDINRNVAARFLIDIDCYFADNTFVKRATAFDRLRDVGPGRSTWKPEDVAVDAVFAQLFQLPAPEHKLVYYHALLAEACKIAPAAIAPSLGRAIRFLYRNSPRMDLELAGRYVGWFAHHLSNFGFTWKWTEWVDDVALPDLHPHKAFIRGAIDKEIRLSFAQRIKNTLPPPYQALIAPATEQDVPSFKYQENQAERGGGDDNDDTASAGGVLVPPAFAAEGRELAALLKRKAPDEDVQAVIERIHSQALDSGRDPLVASTDVFTTAVLWVGSKSLSHVLACIERTKNRFLDAGAASEAARTQILTSVMAFWDAHPGVAIAIAEKLLNYAILSPAAVVQWALVAPHRQQQQQQQQPPPLAQTHVAELAFNTVDKVTRRAETALATATADAAAARTAEANETRAMRDLFRLLDEALQPWLATALTAAAADAGADAGADTDADANKNPSEGALLQAWAVRWQRVVQRRAAVEEAYLAEQAKERQRRQQAAAAVAEHKGSNGAASNGSS
ncbi:cap-binding protein [Niveomyces insectorum RCEF 264]|uniref:Cap-binding protein n=1 Tax=Niveomyces insectorum RCEF 264 TaxID=1081102 RepID=A0A167UN26_9HYPO|nr:cap-binding protein [Niveomyces insectorum RCEF 264]